MDLAVVCMNNFLELEDADHFRFSLAMAVRLNKRYNQSHGTITGKHTGNLEAGCCFLFLFFSFLLIATHPLKDVPGMSISAIPILSSAGLRAYHIEYNGACKKPEVLPLVFRWRAPTGEEILAMVENSYGHEICAPGSLHVLSFMYQVDNSGPPALNDVLAFWAMLRLRFPKANLTASSLDAYALAVLNDAAVYNNLPVVTQEIGDSWLYGAPADPIKVATYREARRLLSQAVQDGIISSGTKEVRLTGYELAVRLNTLMSNS